jgi:capsular polysaccharide biosynthesis protein
LELRWYWRVLLRQWRIIVVTALLVAVLAAGYTAYTYYGGRYLAQSTMEFRQEPPVITTQSVSIDPLGNAQGNAGGARDAAKVFTEQLQYPKSIQAYLLQKYNVNMDWKVIRSGLGANTNAGRFLQLQYKASDSDKAIKILKSAESVLNRDFLPEYNQTVVAAAAGSQVHEFPITTREFDPPSTTTMALSSTAISWLVKAVVGVILGIALAFLWEYLDESIHDEQDVKAWMRLPTLGVVPSGK